MTIREHTTWTLNLPKEPLDLHMAMLIAEDRQRAMQIPCSCGEQPVAFDYTYQREPYVYRQFILCRAGHTEEA